MRTITDRRGVAALEFALIAPAMVVFAIGLFDLVDGTATWWHLTQAAQAIAQIATNSAANTNGTNSLTKQQGYAASTAAYPLVPQLASAKLADFGVTLSSVVFTPTVANCTSGCTYTAAVAWSHTLLTGTLAAARACGVSLVQAANSAAPSSGTLPARFTPLFTTFIAGPIVMMRSAYLTPRAGDDTQWVRYTDPTISQPMCPGYS
jgi:Flp pilus assembly protein TadG